MSHGLEDQFSQGYQASAGVNCGSLPSLGRLSFENANDVPAQRNEKVEFLSEIEFLITEVLNIGLLVNIHQEWPFEHNGSFDAIREVNLSISQMAYDFLHAPLSGNGARANLVRRYPGDAGLQLPDSRFVCGDEVGARLGGVVLLHRRHVYGFCHPDSPVVLVEITIELYGDNRVVLNHRARFCDSSPKR